MDSFTLDDEASLLSGRLLARFSFKNAEQPVASWVEMYQKVLQILYAEDKSIMLDELEYLKKIYRETEKDDRLFALVYYATEEHLWDDIGLLMANPLQLKETILPTLSI